MDGKNEGVFPGGGDIVGSDAGIDKVSQDMTDGVKGQFENTNTKSIGTTGRKVIHG